MSRKPQFAVLDMGRLAAARAEHARNVQIIAAAAARAARTAAVPAQRKPLRDARGRFASRSAQ